MARQRLVERRKHLERFVPACRGATASCHRPPPRAAPTIELVGPLEALGRLPSCCPASSRIRPACRSLKIAYQSGPVSLSIDAIAAFASPGAALRPGRQQRGGQIGDRTAHGLRKIAASRRILLMLEGAHAEHQSRDRDRSCRPGGRVRQAGSLRRCRRSASTARKARSSSSRIARIAAQRRAVIGRCGGRVALRRWHVGRPDNCRTRRGAREVRGRLRLRRTALRSS